MPKVKAQRRSKPKSGIPKTVDEYFAGLPAVSRKALAKMRDTIRSAVPPEAVETISYGIPAFKDKKVLVWFAAFSEHCSLFPTASVIEAHKSELNGFSISKGTVQFPKNKPLPVVLIRKLVKARVRQAQDAASR
jgi:uncharacterized protein YdhG (YjbR/CyaY superfamily)